MGWRWTSSRTGSSTGRSCRGIRRGCGVPSDCCPPHSSACSSSRPWFPWFPCFEPREGDGASRLHDPMTVVRGEGRPRPGLLGEHLAARDAVLGEGARLQLEFCVRAEQPAYPDADLRRSRCPGRGRVPDGRVALVESGPVDRQCLKGVLHGGERHHDGEGRHAASLAGAEGSSGGSGIPLGLPAASTDMTVKQPKDHPRSSAPRSHSSPPVTRPPGLFRDN